MTTTDFFSEWISLIEKGMLLSLLSHFDHINCDNIKKDLEL